ncbi:MAG TPA: hypothetical protein VGN16_19665, partial [Acidobacteriaceae bacterium]
MSPRLANLFDDLRKLSVADCEGLSREEANQITVALMNAAISVDCAMVLAGDFDWMTQKTRELRGMA